MDNNARNAQVRFWLADYTEKRQVKVIGTYSRSMRKNRQAFKQSLEQTFFGIHGTCIRT